MYGVRACALLRTLSSTPHTSFTSLSIAKKARHVMETSTLTQSLQRCEGFCELKMWDDAWNELETLPPELQLDLAVLMWRIQVLMGWGEHRKASFIGLSPAQKFPEKLGILLSTAECLIGCSDYDEAAKALKRGLEQLPENADLWLTLARVEALLGDLESSRDCVRRYVTLNPGGKAVLLSIPELDPLW